MTNVVVVWAKAVLLSCTETRGLPFLCHSFIRGVSAAEEPAQICLQGVKCSPHLVRYVAFQILQLIICWFFFPTANPTNRDVCTGSRKVSVSANIVLTAFSCFEKK